MSGRVPETRGAVTWLAENVFIGQKKKKKKPPSLQPLGSKLPEN